MDINIYLSFFKKNFIIKFKKYYFFSKKWKYVPIGLYVRLFYTKHLIVNLY